MCYVLETGGLADVAGSLPKALHELGHDVRMVLPGYPQCLDSVEQLRPAASLSGVFSKHSYRLGYEGDYATYSDFSTEDFYDHRFFGDTRLDLTRKLDFVFGAQYWLGHDPRASLGNRASGGGPTTKLRIANATG